MSIDEIYDYIESYSRTEINSKKEKIALYNFLSKQIVQGVAKLFDNEVELMNLWDYFPDLFEEEKQEYLKDREEEEFEKFKERRKEFAMRFNKQKKG